MNRFPNLSCTLTLILNGKGLRCDVHTNINDETCNNNCSVEAVEFGFEESVAISNNQYA